MIIDTQTDIILLEKWNIVSPERIARNMSEATLDERRQYLLLAKTDHKNVKMSAVEAYVNCVATIESAYERERRKRISYLKPFDRIRILRKFAKKRPSLFMFALAIRDLELNVSVIEKLISFNQYDIRDWTEYTDLLFLCDRMVYMFPFLRSTKFIVEGKEILEILCETHSR